MMDTPTTSASPLLSPPTAAWVYVGSYTKEKEQGITLFQLDKTSGTLTAAGLAAESRSPSYLVMARDGRHAYAVNESGSGSNREGAVTGYAVDRNSGKLTPINQQSSGGSGPCHLSLTPDGRHLLVANYGSGSVASLPVDDQGRLGEPVSRIQHTGSSVDPKRQKGPHAHFISADPAGRFALAADLGLDKVLVYKIDAAGGQLAPADAAFAGVKPGSGPRHLAFSGNGRFVYVGGEMGNTVTAFRYDAETGRLVEIESQSTLPAGFSETSYIAAVKMHPNGRFLYISNRGHDSLAIFRVDDTTGKLTLVGHESTQGKFPRDFGISPDGSILLAANQNSDNLVVFRIDPETGKLTPTGSTLTVESPACVVFTPAGSESGP